jgi:predicted CoA-binding protein
MPTVAILGASADRGKFGNKSVRAHAACGWTVYPVNPKGGAIEVLPVCSSLSEVPAARLDRVSVYLPPALAVHAMDEIATKGAGEVWLNPGADEPQVVDRARALGLKVVTACSIVALGVSPAEFP